MQAKKLVLLMMLPAMVNAAPYLVTDSWPTTGQQPTSCLYRSNTFGPLETPVAKKSDGSYYCLFDLAFIDRGDTYFKMWAKNSSGESARVPFHVQCTYVSPFTAHCVLE